MKREHLRPLVHAGVFGFAALTPVLGRWGMAAAAGAAVLVNLLVLPRTRFGKSLARPGEPRVGGLVTYPLAVALVFVLFEDLGGAMAWGVLAVGDPAASVAGGSRDWKWRIPWNRRKSIAGLAAFVVGGAAGAAAGAFLVLGVDPVVGMGGDFVPEILLMIALGAVAETLPIPPDDNLPVALAAGSALPLLDVLFPLLAGGAGGG